MPYPASLREPPHAHIVCRVCGRITPIEFADAEREMLIALGARRPDDWGVEGIAFSLTGVCPSCWAAGRA